MLEWRSALYLLRGPIFFSRQIRCHVLSAAFSMDKEWNNRHSQIVEVTKGRDYEWIAAVQKKFSTGGVASAVDVDIAVYGASEKDQLPDVVDILYKLRHSINAADVLPSTEYAAVRNVLDHNAVEILLKFLNDPINYGVFFNVHSACLAIDYFLKKDDFKGAAAVASTVMKQEMFESKLLNFLCVYSALKWIELHDKKGASDLTVLSGNDGEPSDDEMKIFKFPFLKNECFDNHFDLIDANRLIGKTLLWIMRHMNLKPVLARSIILIGAVYYGDFWTACRLLKEGSVFPSAVECCRVLLAYKDNEANPNNFLAALDEAAQEDKGGLLSDALLEEFRPRMAKEESKVIDEQRLIFENWNSTRRKLISSQAEKVNHMLRIKQIDAEIKKIKEERELRHFFENRLHWEDMARGNDEIYEEFKLLEAEEKVSEEQYTRAIFEKARESKVPLSKL